MSVRMQFALSLGLTVAASIAHAETVTICDQRVEYTVNHRPETLSPEAKVLFGVWDGEVLFGIRARMCAGWLIGRIDDNGQFSAKYAYNTATPGINNTAKFGVGTWNGGQYQNGMMVMRGARNSYELRRISENELEGFFILGDGLKYEAKFKRRKAPN